MLQKKMELIERVADVDDELGMWVTENDYPNNYPPEDLLKVNQREERASERE